VVYTYLILPLQQVFDLQCTQIFTNFIQYNAKQYNTISQIFFLRSLAFHIFMSCYQHNEERMHWRQPPVPIEMP